MLPNRFFDDMFNMEVGTNRMDCDIYEKDNTYYIELDLPGFDKKDISIEINKGNITITAEKEEQETSEDKKYFRKERKVYGKYERSFYLGEVMEENVKANFDGGILTIAIPKRLEENNKRQIEIQ